MGFEHIDLETVLVWSPGAATQVLVVIVVIWLIGYVSRRVLHNEPDFEQKSAMLQGTWQVPAALTGLFAFWHLLVFVGVTYTEYPLSFLFGSQFGILLVVVLSVWLIPNKPLAGWMAAPQVLGAHLKRQGIEWDSVFARMEQHRRTRWWRIGMPASLIVFAGMLVWMLAFTVQHDREVAGFKRLFELEESMNQQLAHLQVENVTVAGPPAVASRVIWVRVHAETSDQEMTAVYDHAQEGIEQLDPRHRWKVSVVAGKCKSARFYPPEDSPPAP